MTNLTVSRVTRYTNEGYPALCIDFIEPDVPRACLGPEARRWIYGRGFDVVHLGPGFEDLIAWQHPDGRIFRGVTDDPEIVAFVKDWLGDLEEKKRKLDEEKQSEVE